MKVISELKYFMQKVLDWKQSETKVMQETEMLNICFFMLLQCEDVLVFSVLYKFTLKQRFFAIF